MFKHDFYPGEIAIATINAQRANVYVHDKATFNAIQLPNGEVRPATCKCRVEILPLPGQEAIVNESVLMRDRKSFTKVTLKTFIKHSVHRESWAGAPWLVKDEYAKIHRIDQTIPIHLQRHKGQPSPEDLKQQRLEKRKQIKEEKLRQKLERALEVKRLKQEAKQQKLDQMLDSHKNTQRDLKIKHDESYPNNLTNSEIRGELLQSGLLSLTPNRDNLSAANSGTATPIISEDSLAFGAVSLKQERPSIQEDLLFPYDSVKARERPPHHVEKKLDKPHLINIALETWLFLNMYNDPLILDTFTFDDYLDVLHYDDPEIECPLLNEIFCSLLSTFVGTESTDLLVQFPDPLIDVYDGDEDEEYSGDALPTDDENMADSNETLKEEDESSSTKDLPKNDIKLENGDSEEKDIKEEDNEDDGDNERLQDDKQDEDEEDDEQPQSDESVTNRAEAFSRFKSTPWDERLRRRMFKDGGWQVILIGLLYNLDYVPEWKANIQSILDVIAPLDKAVTLNTALTGFMNLSSELRLKAIQILCDMLHSSTMVRNFIDKSLDESTRIRRERLENLREYKNLLETLKYLEEQKKPYFPNGFAKALQQGSNSTTSNTASNSPLVEPIDDFSEDEQKYHLFSVGGKRSASSVTRQRKKRKNDAELALAKKNPEFKKLFQQCEAVLNKIEKLLDANHEFELELVKIDIQRAKMLGQDKYYNRYWWLEGNGIRRSSEKSMKRGQEKGNDNKRSKSKQSDSSSDDEEDADEDLGYLMGRIWVQGPTEEEAQGYLNIESDNTFPEISTNEQGQIVAKGKVSGMEVSCETENKDFSANGSVTGIKILVDNSGTVDSTLSLAERKSLEEGENVLKSHLDWGYYDDPEDVQKLLGWLNLNGKRESKLYKEITETKGVIIDSMKARKDDLTNDLKEQEVELENALKDDEDINEIDEKIAKAKELIESLSLEPSEALLTSIDSEFPKKDDTKEAENLTQNRRKSTRLVAKSSASPHSSPKSKKTHSFISKDVLEEKSAWLSECVQTLTDERAQTIEDYKKELALGRVLGWENGKAKEKLGHTLYEWQKKRPNTRNSSKRK